MPVGFSMVSSSYSSVKLAQAKCFYMPLKLFLTCQYYRLNLGQQNTITIRRAGVIYKSRICVDLYNNARAIGGVAGLLGAPAALSILPSWLESVILFVFGRIKPDKCLDNGSLESLPEVSHRGLYG